MEKIKIKIICKGKEEKYLEREIELQGKQWEEIKDKIKNFGEWINGKKKGKTIAQLKRKERKNKVEKESIETLGKDDKQTTDRTIQKEEEERREKKMKIVGKLMKRTKREEKEKVEKSMIEFYIEAKRKEGNVVELWYKYMEERIKEIERVKEEQKKGDKAAREILNKRILKITNNKREALRSRNKRATKIYLLFHQLGQIDRIREVECNMMEINEFKNKEIEWIVKEVLRIEQKENS